MKKIIFLFSLLAAVTLYAQNYPGKMPELLLNREVKVLEVPASSIKYGYDDFYKDKSLKKVYACCDSYNSKYDKLVNRVFTVKEVKPYGSSYSSLTLEDDKEIIYFRGVFHFDWNAVEWKNLYILCNNDISFVLKQKNQKFKALTPSAKNYCEEERRSNL